MPPFLKPVATTTLVAMLSLAGCASTPASSGLAVEESTTLNASPETVWATIGQFDNVSWHPVVARTELVPGPGAPLRLITTGDGAQLRERLVALDTVAHRYSYRIEVSPLPVKAYESTLRIEPQGSGSRVVWSSHFERDPAAAGVSDAQAREIVTGIYRAGLDALQKRYGR